MCGIAGFVSDRFDSAPGILRDMGQYMRNRGPDDEGIVVDGNVGLVHRRLSIIDLDGGKNPIYNEDNTICAMLNGEIYNYRELRSNLKNLGHVFSTSSDTEVLVHLYEQYGCEFVERLNGMFAFVLFDKTTRKILLCRDRMGQKPLYFMNHNGYFAFASDIRCFECLPEMRLSVDYHAAYYFLCYQYVPAPLSIYNEVKKMSAGTCIEYCEGRVRHYQYWNIPTPVSSSNKRTIENVNEEFESLLQDSVRMRMVADVPVGSFLSGGLDSSVITSLMTRYSGREVKTFAIGFTESSYDESDNARKVSRDLGTQHEELILSGIPIAEVDVILSEFGEPFADASALPTYYLCKLASDYVKVALSGDGADELLGGYNRYKVGKLMNFYQYVPEFLRPGSLSELASILPDSDQYYATSIFSKLKHSARVVDTFSQVTGSSSSRMFTPFEFSNAILKENWQWNCDPVLTRDRYCQHLRWPENMLHADCRSYLPDDILVKVDRMSMAHSLEVRSPFLDYRLVEFICGLPMKYKYSGSVTKRVLRELASEKLPAVVVQKKHGFEAPIASWLKHELHDKLVSLIELQQLPFINHRYFFNLAHEHKNRGVDHSKKLWPLYVLLNWMYSHNSKDSI